MIAMTTSSSTSVNADRPDLCFAWRCKDIVGKGFTTGRVAKRKLRKAVLAKRCIVPPLAGIIPPRQRAVTPWGSALQGNVEKHDRHPEPFSRRSPTSVRVKPAAVGLAFLAFRSLQQKCLLATGDIIQQTCRKRLFNNESGRFAHSLDRNAVMWGLWVRRCPIGGVTRHAAIRIHSAHEMARWGSMVPSMRLTLHKPRSDPQFVAE